MTPAVLTPKDAGPETGRRRTMSRPLPDARALLPVVRRLMTTGVGPPGLADWAARYGLTPGHGPADDPTARRLADRLAEAVRTGLAVGSAPSSRDTVPVPCGID